MSYAWYCRKCNRSFAATTTPPEACPLCGEANDILDIASVIRSPQDLNKNETQSSSKPRTLLRSAITGAICAFLFVFIEMIYEILFNGPEQHGGMKQSSVLGDYVVWWSSPVLWLLESARRADLYNPENFMPGLGLVAIYWMLLGAIAAIAVHYLIALIRRGHQFLNQSEGPK